MQIKELIKEQLVIELRNVGVASVKPLKVFVLLFTNLQVFMNEANCLWDQKQQRRTRT